MDCERASDLAVLLREGRLPASEAAGVREHLADCPACRRWLVREEALRRILSETEPLLAPDDLWPRLERRIRSEEERRRRARRHARRLVPLLVPLAAAAVLLVGLLLKGARQAPPPPPSISADAYLAATLQEHARLANESFLDGDELLVVESTFPPEVVRGEGAE